ncbi:transketolase subunit B [Caloramator quimbayensis]|uniref:Transketolase subunit B n=1 Tax=Caloramator quimbayensis TaxID=1147123 RepID=A0A1T4XX56_9CLOT|nr:transketolase C-terminal domain-containing protein [Caloramator quimbayensis]SKA93645.1 transketolase subunit B [Caloramator quimbayensis]
MYENVEVRQVFCNTLDKMMSENPKIVVLDADLAKANGTLSLRNKYADRAFDMGVAEQNMAGVAAGMAAYGFIPFIGSFTAFAARRICDQIAISITYAKRNVKIIGSDPGVSAELNGGTHMSMEDIGVLRSIPGIVIFEAADAVELEKALYQIVSYDGPVYIRLFRKVAPVIYNENYDFNLFKADVLKEGKDVTLLASGIMVNEALKACEILKEEGIMAEVINVHTIKPLDKETILNSVRKTGAVVTCENHNVIGGLKSAVAELLIEECPVYLKSVGVLDHFGEVAPMDYLMKKYNMTPENIVSAAKEAIKKGR